LFTALTAGSVALFLPHGSPLLLLIGGLGAFAFTLHPVSIAHVSRRLDRHQLIEGTARLLLVKGVGSVIAPLLASLFMVGLGPGGLMVLMALLAGFQCAYSLWARRRRPQKLMADND